MADMLKIGIKTITSKEIQPEKHELKLYIGEKISARVEKGGNGEGILTVKGFQINARGNTEFKNGEIISLKIKGMEDGNILVESVKDEEKAISTKVMEEKNLKTVKLKEDIIREGIEQKTVLSKEKIEKIANSYREIELESERIKKEKTEKKNEVFSKETTKKEILEKTELKSSLKDEVENKGKEESKENSIFSKNSKESSEDLKEKNSKFINLEVSLKQDNNKLKEKSLNIIQNSNKEIIKELTGEYSEKDSCKRVENKNIIKELGKFIAEKEIEFNKNKESETLKTLVKLENSLLGLNPEAFKLLHSFYGQEMAEKIEINENLKESIKSFIKNISEGESNEAKGTLVANVINRSEGNNTLEFILNIAQFKSPCEIKIIQEDGSKESEVKKIKYFTVKLDLEKLGKMAVTVFLNYKNSIEIYFAVENEEKKKLVASEFDKLNEMFQAKGINIGNIRVLDKNRVEDKINTSLDFKI